MQVQLVGSHADDARVEFFKRNVDKVRTLLFDLIAALPEKRECRCAESLGPLPH